MSLAFDSGDYGAARAPARAKRVQRARSWAPASRPQPIRGPAFVRGEALALATALRFHDASHAALSARDLDKVLGRLSTRHLEALLSLEVHSRPMIAPPLRTEL